MMSGTAQMGPEFPPLPAPPRLIATEETNLTRLAEAIARELNISSSDVNLELVEINSLLIERNISIDVDVGDIYIQGDYSYDKLWDVVDAASCLKRAGCKWIVIGVETGTITLRGVFKARFGSTLLISNNGVNYRAATSEAQSIGDFEILSDRIAKTGFMLEEIPDCGDTWCCAISPEFPIEPEMAYDGETSYLQELFDGFNEQLEVAGISPELRFW